MTALMPLIPPIQPEQLVLDSLKYLVRFGRRDCRKEVNDRSAVFEDADQEFV
jgi:hypothetical protein